MEQFAASIKELFMCVVQFNLSDPEKYKDFSRVIGKPLTLTVHTCVTKIVDGMKWGRGGTW